MNKLKKAVFALMTIFPILSLAACSPSKQEAAQKIESHLEKKYNESFVVTGIGGGYGTISTNTLKANVHPKNEPDLKFKAEITKDYKEVWESYMNVIMADKLGKQVEEMAQKNFASEAIVNSSMSTGALSYPNQKLNDKNMSVQEFLKETPKTQISLFIFLKSNGSIDAGAEAEKISNLSDQIMEQGIKTGYIGLDVFYLKPAAFTRIKGKYKDFSDNNEVYEFYSTKEQSFAKAGMSIENGVKQETPEEIKTNLE